MDVFVEAVKSRSWWCIVLKSGKIPSIFSLSFKAVSKTVHFVVLWWVPSVQGRNIGTKANGYNVFIHSILCLCL